MNLTESFLRNLVELSQKEIPQHVYAKARFCLLDFIGGAFAGSRLHQLRTEEYLEAVEGEYKGFSTIIGLSRKSSMQNAALINGFNVHATEMDDGHRYGMLHLGAAIISAIIASAEKEGRGLSDILRGIILGYEAAIRLASAIQPMHKKNGYHTSGTCGTIGAAIGVAFMNNYDYDQLHTTLDAASTSAAGILEIQEDASELKPYNLARAAMDGLTAAYIARARWFGPEDILGGKRGFLNIFGFGKVNIDLLLNSSDHYAIEGIYMKPYAACRHCHAPIEGALKLIDDNEILPEQIESVIIETYSMAVFGHDHVEIHGSASAKLSIPFSVALAIMTGDVSLSQFETMYNDPEVIKFTKLVRVVENKELSDLVPSKRAAIITINTKSNHSFSIRVDNPLGEPENPMTEQDLINKFVSLAKYAGMETSKCNMIINKVLNNRV